MKKVSLLVFLTALSTPSYAMSGEDSPEGPSKSVSYSKPWALGDTMPNEIEELIFSFMPIESLKKARGVNKHFNRVIVQDSFTLLVQHFDLLKKAEKEIEEYKKYRSTLFSVANSVANNDGYTKKQMDDVSVLTRLNTFLVPLLINQDTMKSASNKAKNIFKKLTEENPSIQIRKINARNLLQFISTLPEEEKMKNLAIIARNKSMRLDIVTDLQSTFINHSIYAPMTLELLKQEEFSTKVYFNLTKIIEKLPPHTPFPTKDVQRHIKKLGKKFDANLQQLENQENTLISMKNSSIALGLD